MARYVDYIVDTTGNPVVTIFVTTRAVTCGVVAFEAREVGLDKAVMVAPDRAALARPRVFDNQVTFTSTLDLFAFVIEQRRLHTEEWTCRRTRLSCSGTWQRHDHDAASLGLPPGINDWAVTVTEDTVVPLPSLWVDWLAD